MRKQQGDRPADKEIQATTQASLEGITENELLDELISRVPPQIQKGDVTTASLREALKKKGIVVSRSWAISYLNKEVEKHRLIKVSIMTSTGGNGFAYRKPPE